MTTEYRPVRTTIILGGMGALVWFLANWAIGGYWAWPLMAFGIIWLMTASYAMVLVRWSARGLLESVFPLLVLGCIGVMMPRSGMALGLVLIVLSWIRSGVCFPRSPLQSLFRELILCGGGGLVVALWGPSTPIAWVLSIWLFSLVQSLFFVLFEPATRSSASLPDPFDLARHRIENLLDG